MTRSGPGDGPGLGVSLALQFRRTHVQAATLSGEAFARFYGTGSHQKDPRALRPPHSPLGLLPLLIGQKLTGHGDPYPITFRIFFFIHI